MRQNISKPKFKPTSNYTKSIKIFAISYTRGKEENIESLDLKNVFDNKEIWKTMRPILSDKNTTFSQISIEKINQIISHDFDLCEEFSTFSEEIAIKKFENQ